jgi:hypothetical protein
MLKIQSLNLKLTRKYLLLLAFQIAYFLGFTQPIELKSQNMVWQSQSKNASESMPLGGGDIGLNVWVEGDEVLFYISKSGTFDANNALLKLGRVRLKISPNPFTNSDFKQELNLYDGNILIIAANEKLKSNLNLWVDVFRPVIHVEMNSSVPTKIEANYESWRYQDRKSSGKENNANSYKWTGKNVITKKDNIAFQSNEVQFFHQNGDSTMFDITVAQQGMRAIKDQMTDPLKNLTFGGLMTGYNLIQGSTGVGKYMDTDFKSWSLVSEKPSKNHELILCLSTNQTADLSIWKEELNALKTSTKQVKNAKLATLNWWHDYWNRSFIFIDRPTKDSVWQTSRNYQLFRYMLGCNAFGSSPTKFNGGLFTYDPSGVDSSYNFTPDHRNWGGGTHTAQNQRLVYFPMLKSGDFDLMVPQFEFYMNALKNAELRSQHYWNHDGGCFTEQIENFGLPNYAEYGSKRPADYDPGMEYNAWLEYQWDTVLEFCLMILETENYGDKDISRYIPLIESSLTFFDEHYQYLANQRGRKTFDGNGDLVFYPGSACETYKMAYNATSTVVGLKVVLEKLLTSKYQDESHREKWELMLDRIPPINFQQIKGKTTIAPAKLWERINNTEAPQLYPVFPWHEYGVGKRDLDIAINTYKLDPDVQKFQSHVGWKQTNIWAADLGLTEEAVKYTTMKLKDSGRRFPAFWGPGFDWVPDHNWGGSGAIGLQDMLLQTKGDSILIFPAWPKEWDVHFKLYAPKQTIIEVEYKNGELKKLEVSPDNRKKDIVILLEGC